jgi:hypothetical protein
MAKHTYAAIGQSLADLRALQEDFFKSGLLVFRVLMRPHGHDQLPAKHCGRWVN